MNFEQLVAEIFDDYQNKHKDILGDTLITSAQQAEKILAKYNTSKLSPEQKEQIKKMIVQREVEEFSTFVQQNKDILEADLSDNEKFRQLLTKHDNPHLTEEERVFLKKKLRRHIYDHTVSHILIDLVNNLKQQ